MKEVHREPTRPSPSDVDDTDLAILQLLSQDGRMSNSAVAEAVGIAPSTCLNRIRQLRDAGVIRGFQADIDPGAIGRPLQAVVFVRLQPSARSRIATFATYLAGLPGENDKPIWPHCAALIWPHPGC